MILLFYSCLLFRRMLWIRTCKCARMSTIWKLWSKGYVSYSFRVLYSSHLYSLCIILLEPIRSRARERLSVSRSHFGSRCFSCFCLQLVWIPLLPINYNWLFMFFLTEHFPTTQRGIRAFYSANYHSTW